MASYLAKLVALLIKILVEWAELVAFEESLKVASAINISKLIFESDCANLVNRDDLISGLTTYLFQQLVYNFGGLTTTMCSGSLFANWRLCPDMYWCVMDA
ncbi:hypothetical protein Gogos_010216 [Gossypium gossypioides]|uniref:RNase H type-1 domain-containing protein n=1 Tax=Gossypium gossypioides TaxID=34282 RepID=A0A7J9BKH8_GOSGO|nr:hypothetical protein [Gossypium gossypioides]